MSYRGLIKHSKHSVLTFIKFEDIQQILLPDFKIL